MKLTQEQSDLARDNHKLIFGYARDHNLDLEEWYGLLAIELCKATKIHDEGRGNLSTLFYIMCDNLRRSIHRSNNTLKRQDGGLLSLDHEYDDYEDGYTLIDTMVSSSDDSLEDIVIINDIYDRLLSGKHGEVVKLRCEGYTQEQIASVMGYTQQYVSEILQGIRDEYENEMR